MKKLMTLNPELVLVGLLALAWAALALASTTTREPPVDRGLWVVSGAIPIGGALAVLRHRSRHSVDMYLGSVLLVALIRSVAYIRIDAWSPSAVWTIVFLTSILAMMKVRRDS